MMDYLEKRKFRHEFAKNEKGFYLYCIMLDGTAVLEDHKGIDGLGSLFSIQYRNLTAVVSEVELNTFKSGMAAAGDVIDMEWLEEKARIHEAIVEHLLKEYTLLPARFCSIMRNKEDIIVYLADNYLKYTRALERLKGREEWSVKVYLSLEKFTQFISEHTPEIRGRREKLSSMSVKASFLMQRKIDNLIKEQMDKRIETIRSYLSEVLRDASESESISDEEFFKQQQIENLLVFKAAYLVEENLWQDFNCKIKSLSAELEPEGITLVINGPWPPYSFVEDEKELDIERSLVRLLFPIR